MDDQVTQNQDQTTGVRKAPGVPIPPPKADNPTERHGRAIRTYYSDIAETVQGRNVSMADVAIAEQRRQEVQAKVMPTPPPSESPEPKENVRKSWRTFAIVLALVLIVGGGGILGFVYIYVPTPEVVIPENFVTTLIPVESEFALDITDLSAIDVKTLIDEERIVLDGTLNTIVAFVPVETLGEQQEIIPAREFLQKLETNADTALQRSILNEYSLGVHLFDKNHGFLVVKTDFFENAFAGMLRWEQYMADDLPFLTKDATPAAEPESVASTTEPAGIVVLEPIEQYKFQDVVVANRDARALVNSVTGDISMIYSFPDKNTLIITTNPNTLVELFDRLTKVRRQ